MSEFLNETPARAKVTGEDGVHEVPEYDPWEHRSSRMRCVTCMWFVDKVSSNQVNRIGRCRRRAPTMSGYPVVFDTDWCGDHKLDENK